MINLSAKESSVLGVRVARGVLPADWQPHNLLQAILTGNFDFVRVKLPSIDEQVFNKLDELGMHYCTHSILVRNSIPITVHHAQPSRPLRVSFELYDGSQELQLRQLVKDSWGYRTAVNYHNPYYKHWVSYAQEVEGSAAYATEFNHQLDPSMPNWLVKLGEEVIGFVLGKVSNEGFEGIMYSILPNYRGHNYAEDIMIFLKKWCYEQGIAVFFNDVVFQNMPSLKSIVSESILPVDTFLNVTISPLLHANSHKSLRFAITNWQNEDDIHVWIASNSQSWVKPGYRLRAINSTDLNTLRQPPTHVVVSAGIDAPSLHLVLLKLKREDSILSLVYLTYLPIA